MADITAQDLIRLFQQSLSDKWGYIYGASGQLWTKEKQAATENAQAKKYGLKWTGHYVADCSGLFVWAFEKLGGSIYHGSNTIWEKYCSAKGNITGGKKSQGGELLPGTAVFKVKTSNGNKDRYHIGLFIGGTTVIEAKGTSYGVVKSSVSEWHEWGELKDVVYGDAPKPQPVPEGQAVVIGNAVALRAGPGTNCPVLLRVATNQKVNLEKPPDDWERVSYNGKFGYMMSKYIKKG